MTILEIAKYIAPQISIETMTALMASTVSEHVELANHINSAGQEIATRIDWPQMRVDTTLTGLGATPVALPGNYSRMIKGRAVTFSGWTVRGGLSSEEFNRLTPTSGTPRFFRITGKTIELWPNTTSTFNVSFISRDWITGGKALATADTDSPVFDDQLVIKGALWRWRRMKGLEYKDYLDEFEAEMAKYEAFGTAERMP